MRFGDIVNLIETQNVKTLFRIVDPGEYRLALESGSLKPTKFYGRIHASYEPELQYGKSGDLVLEIEFDSADGWKVKQGDKEYVVTDQPISLEKVKILKTIGDKPFKFINVEFSPYKKIDGVVGDLEFKKEYNTVLPKIYNANYRSLYDDNGLLATSISVLDEFALAYRTKDGFQFVDDTIDFFDDVRGYDILFGKLRKFIQII